MSKYMPALCQEYMRPHPPRTRAPLLSCAEEFEPWLTTQWQTEKQHILLAEDGHIFFDMPSTSGYMGEKYFQEFGPRFFFLTCPQLVGTWVKKMFRNLVPDVWRVMLFLACHVLNVACHGVSISIVSIISLSCRVRILHVSMFMPCHGHLDYHFMDLETLL